MTTSLHHPLNNTTTNNNIPETTTTAPTPNDEIIMSRIREHQQRRGHVPDEEDFEYDQTERFEFNDLIPGGIFHDDEPERSPPPPPIQRPQLISKYSGSTAPTSTRSGNDNDGHPNPFKTRKERHKEQKQLFFRGLLKSSYVLASFLVIVGFGFVLESRTSSPNALVAAKKAFGRDGTTNQMQVTPTMNVDLSVLSRYDALKYVLLSVSDEISFAGSDTPQYKALTWLTYDDPLEVPIPTTEVEKRKVVQRYALACLFFGSHGEMWTKKHHFMTKRDECDWNDTDENGFFNGVGGCGPDGQVTMIALWNNNLRGHVPREVGELTKLRILSLYSNRLRGPLAGNLAKLTSLRTLYLHGNELTGSIDFFCNNKVDNFRADCHGTEPEVVCSCCSVCCSVAGVCYQNSNK